MTDSQWAHLSDYSFRFYVMSSLFFIAIEVFRKKTTIIILTEKVCSFGFEAIAVGDSLKCPCEMFISIPEASEQFSP